MEQRNREEKRHKCKRCGVAFKDYSELKGHWKDKHEGELRRVMEFIEQTKHVGDVNED